MRGFLGLSSYYRKFIKGYDQISHPLVLLLKGNKKFLWIEVVQQDFEKLKKKNLTASLSLALPNFTQDLIIGIDGSGIGIGVVLIQNSHLIAYISN